MTNDHNKKPDPAPEPIIDPIPPPNPDPKDDYTPYWEKKIEDEYEKAKKEYEDRYENPKWDRFGLSRGQSPMTIIAFIAMVIFCNIVHTYVMVVPSEMWATYSSILVIQSGFHYATGAAAFLLLIRHPTYVT